MLLGLQFLLMKIVIDFQPKHLLGLEPWMAKLVYGTLKILVLLSIGLSVVPTSAAWLTLFQLRRRGYDWIGVKDALELFRQEPTGIWYLPHRRDVEALPCYRENEISILVKLIRLRREGREL
mgnify:FL=1